MSRGGDPEETDPSSVSLAGVFHALGNDDRLALLATLRVLSPYSASIEELSIAVGISRFAASRHLRILREAGLAEGARIVHQYRHRLSSRHFERIDAWLLELFDAALLDEVELKAIPRTDQTPGRPRNHPFSATAAPMVSIGVR